MGVTFIAPQGTYTSPAKLITKTITENDTYNAIDDNANGYSSVVVNVEGGGGSSDFSTVVVTASVNTDAFYISNAIKINYDDKMKVADGFVSGNYTLVLYKGSFEGQISAAEGYRVSNVTGTGGVTVIQSPFGKRVAITGDGTLTVELTQN